jgi:hypothetical protein
MRGIVLISVLATLSLSCVAAAQVGPTALTRLAPTEWLSGQQIRDRLVGNTIAGVENGKDYVEYLRMDGTISGRDANGDYTGQWRIDNDQICFRYSEDEQPEESNFSSKTGDWDCSHIMVKGSQLRWSARAHTPAGEVATLTAGNPKGL